jgi:hypothetical protein
MILKSLKGTYYEIMNGFSKQSDFPSYPPDNSLVRMNHDTVDPQVTVADFYFAFMRGSVS